MKPEDCRGRGFNLDTGIMGDIAEWDERFRNDAEFRARAIANHKLVLDLEAGIPPVLPPRNRRERRRR